MYVNSKTSQITFIRATKIPFISSNVILIFLLNITIFIELLGTAFTSENSLKKMNMIKNRKNLFIKERFSLKLKIVFTPIFVINYTNPIYLI